MSTIFELTEAQTDALRRCCERYKVEFDPSHYSPDFSLPTGWVSGWIGGPDRGFTDNFTRERGPRTTIYVGCSPEGDINS